MPHRRLGPLVAILGLAASSTLLDAQSVPAAQRAAATIVAPEIHDRIAVIADDSMRGRATPSPELEQVAAYIAGQFRSFGLAPGGDSGSFIQRYAIRQVRTDTTSFVMAMGRGAHGHWFLGRDAFLAFGQPPAKPVTAPVVLVTGVPADTATPFGDTPLSGTIVIQVARSQVLGGDNLLSILTKAAAGGARAWITVTNLPAPRFAELARRSLAPQDEVAGAAHHGVLPISIYVVRDGAAAELLRAAGLDVAALLAPGAAPSAQALPGFTATIDVHRSVVGTASAPNTIGVLEGSDPRLRHQYVFFTAHMDHIGVPGSGEGCTPVGADSICNGADDDGSGAIGVVELAQAFSRLNPRPRRSLVFMTVSGEERGLWGSTYYTSHPAFPLAATVADLNADMIGRNPVDGVMAIGKDYSSLGPLVDSIAARHPELRIRVIGDTMPQEQLFYRSDHFNFARKGIPILFFTTGLHRDYHRPTDSVDKIDAGQEARILRLIFYLGLQVANAPSPPTWNPESRRQIVEEAGRQ
jgi:hypothetical protein